MKRPLPQNLRELSASLATEFKRIEDATQTIKHQLEKHADGKQLKGDEITGWLGEIYGKMILNGTLVPDKYEYDFKAQDKRVSVKARKGMSRGWEITSIIPRIEGDECPTDLMFVQFTDSYSIKRVWLFPWKDLQTQGRFIKKRVRSGDRGYYMRIKPSVDKCYQIYP